MQRLKPRLLALGPGTRVVSHHFTLGDWEPEEGVWQVGLAGQDFRLRIERRYQKLAASGEREGRALHVIAARLRGTELWFTSFDRDGATSHFHGRLEKGRMEGTSGGWPGIEPQRWSAVRATD